MSSECIISIGGPDNYVVDEADTIQSDRCLTFTNSHSAGIVCIQLGASSGTDSKFQVKDSNGNILFSIDAAGSVGLSAGGKITLANECHLQHDGTHSTITSSTGDFSIINQVNDKKIIMKLGTKTTDTAFEVQDIDGTAVFWVKGDGSNNIGGGGSLPSGSNHSDALYWNSATVPPAWVLSGNSLRLGQEAGKTNQGTMCTALGFNAGKDNQGNGSIAIGWAGTPDQGVTSVAIGNQCGHTQGKEAVCIGYKTAEQTQGDFSIAIGKFAATDTQGENSVAIGQFAGRKDQGDKCIALGFEAASSTEASQPSGSFFIGMETIRNSPNVGTARNLEYDSTTGEIYQTVLRGGGGGGNTEWLNAWFNNLSFNVVSAGSWTSLFALETATVDALALSIDGSNRVQLTAGKTYKLDANAMVGDNTNSNQFISLRIRLNDTTNIIHTTTRVFVGAGCSNLAVSKVYVALEGDFLSFELKGASGGGSPQVLISYNVCVHDL